MLKKNGRKNSVARIAICSALVLFGCLLVYLMFCASGWWAFLALLTFYLLGEAITGTPTTKKKYIIQQIYSSALFLLFGAYFFYRAFIYNGWWAFPAIIMLHFAIVRFCRDDVALMILSFAESLPGALLFFYWIFNGNTILFAISLGLIGCALVRASRLDAKYASSIPSYAVDIKPTEEKEASVIGRAVVGGVIAGGAGAVVGALSAMDKNNKTRSKNDK